jgi:hypothetical protein
LYFYTSTQTHLAQTRQSSTRCATRPEHFTNSVQAHPSSGCHSVFLESVFLLLFSLLATAAQRRSPGYHRTQRTLHSPTASNVELLLVALLMLPLVMVILLLMRLQLLQHFYYCYYHHYHYFYYYAHQYCLITPTPLGARTCEEHPPRDLSSISIAIAKCVPQGT